MFTFPSARPYFLSNIPSDLLATSSAPVRSLHILFFICVNSDISSSSLCLSNSLREGGKGPKQINGSHDTAEADEVFY